MGSVKPLNPRNRYADAPRNPDWTIDQNWRVLFPRGARPLEPPVRPSSEAVAEPRLRSLS